MTELPLFWDRFGSEIELEGMPDAIEKWDATNGATLEEPQLQLLRTVEGALGLQITKMDLLARDSNLVSLPRTSSLLGAHRQVPPQVVKVEYSNGQRAVVRTPYLRADDPGLEKNHPIYLAKFWREMNLLKWLTSSSSMPVPGVHAIIDAPRPDLFPCAIIDFVPGTLLLNACGRFPYAIKEHLMYSFAKISVELFRLEVPQQIGTLEISKDGALNVIPWKTINHGQCATEIFETLEDFIDYLIQRKLNSNAIGSDPTSRARGKQVLALLTSKLQPILSQLNKPSHRRCVLTHDDLNQTNILVDSLSGDITGLIDWEFQSVRPAVLAANYPPCVQYHGLGGDPRLDDEDGVFWTTSPQDATRLRALYAEVIISLASHAVSLTCGGHRLSRIWIGSTGRHSCTETSSGRR
ncbi:hypothetical protein C8Q77DRAFT_710875 [Trametes polyzona]|nr:hypothetical protein C8Q77DRAFT_710875 [Trametes polyzona]